MHILCRRLAGRRSVVQSPSVRCNSLSKTTAFSSRSCVPTTFIPLCAIETRRAHAQLDNPVLEITFLSMRIPDVQEDMTTGRAASMNFASSPSWPSTKRRRRDGSRARDQRSSTCPSISMKRKPTKNAGASSRQSRLAPHILGVVLLLLGTPAHLILPAHAFYFQWSSTSYQCYTQTLSWVGGEPPFKAILA